MGRQEMPQLQMTEDQVRMYAPQVVALETSLSGATIKEIAKQLGISPPKVQRIKKSDEYRRLVDLSVKRSEAQVERMTRENTLEIRQKLALYSGEAVEVLVELMRTADKDSVRLGAACELIDRDGRFAKVSRLMNVPQGQDGAPMLPEDVSAEIMQHLKNAKIGMVQ